MNLTAVAGTALAEAVLAEARADLYSLMCQHAVVLATWRYRTGRPVAGI
jgi:hypothetical protein